MSEFMHRAQLCGRRQIGPRMVALQVRIVDGFVSNGIGDEYVRLHLPDKRISVDAREPDAGAAIGYYTIRSWSPVTGLAEILFLCHGHGRAASWAQQAELGSGLHLSAQRGGYAPHRDARQIVLAGDATALPAIARILAADPRPELSALVQIESAAERGTVTDDPRVAWMVARYRDQVLARALRRRGGG